MTTIYKFHSKKTKQIWVFIGENTITEKGNTITLDDLFKENQDHDIFKEKKVFSEDGKELEEIKREKIEVKFVDEYIHVDDTIETIKKKLLKQLVKNISVSFDELYLFFQQPIQLNPINVYQTLTKNSKVDLTKQNIARFSLNIENVDREEGSALSEAAAADEEDGYKQIEALNIYKTPSLLSKPLGQFFNQTETDYEYLVNPYNITSADIYKDLKITDITEIVTTTNKNILMNVGEIEHHCIYFCLAEELLTYIEPLGVSQENIIKIYFPYLAEKNIMDLNKLNLNNEKLKLETEKLLNAAFDKNVSNVNLFYDVYNGRKNKPTTKYSFTEYGIKKIEITLHPLYTFNIPLDIIFKLIHATKNHPFIKYNPDKRREKMYRIHTDKITTNGKKIPSLSKAKIFKLIKEIGLNQCVAVYIDTFYKEKNYEIVCEFEKNGNITIRATFNEVMKEEDINELFILAVNPVITIIKDYISQNGYKMETFKNLNETNIEILNMIYVMSVPMKSESLNFKPIMGCVSSVFSILEENISKGIIMRFKRVSNYNEMNSQEAFIVDNININTNEHDIIQGLISNYNLTDVKAREKYSSFVTSLQTMQTAFQNKKIKVKNNPGFSIIIIKKKNEENENMILVTITGINDVGYLTTIPIYVDSLLRITQDPNSTSIKKSIIDAKCKKVKIVEEKQIKDIVTEESKIATLGVPIIAPLQEAIEDYKGMEEEQEEGVNMLDILLGFGDDEDEDEDENENEDDNKAEDENKAEENIDVSEIGGGKPKLSARKEKESDDEDVGAAAEADEDEGQASAAAEDEDEDEDEDDEDEDDEEKDKGATLTLAKKDITGMRLNNPSPFFKKMQKLDPTLFPKKSEGAFNSYSTSCAWTKSHRKQPVLITNEEKQKIDEKDKSYEDGEKSYDQAIQYGTTDKKYWYICPQYWSFKDNMSLTKEEVKSGKYGKVIPSTTDIVPADATIFNFQDTKHSLNDKGEYIKNFPSMMNTSKHPDGKCMPCCGKKKQQGTKAQKELEKKCNLIIFNNTKEGIKKQQEQQQQQQQQQQPNPAQQQPMPSQPQPMPAQQQPQDISEAVTGNVESKDSTASVTDYIFDFDAFPLNEFKYGTISPSLQKFLQIDEKEYKNKTKKMIEDKNKNKIKNKYLDFPYIFRHGVKSSQNQSFIACIADIFSTPETTLTISQMRNIFLQKIDLDKFMTLQNGDLIDLFYNEGMVVQQDNDDEDHASSMEKYKKTKIYETIFSKKKYTNFKEREFFLKKLINSYENYHSFLKDDNVEINYKYVWDLICKPNYLSKDGCNMLILDIINDGIKEVTHIICPSNHYSNQLFNRNLKTIIIIKKDNYYEPLYIVKKTTQTKGDVKTIITKKFEITDDKKKNDYTLNKFLISTEEIINTKCLPLPSIPKKYNYKEEVLDSIVVLERLLKLLKAKTYTITKQIINYNGKVLGVLATTSADNITGFIPCYPSNPILNIPFIWVDDMSYVRPYKETIDFLINVNKEYQNEKNIIHCKPKFKIVKKGKIIGILTEANQFIHVADAPYEDYDKTKDDANAYNDNKLEVLKEKDEGKYVPFMPEVERTILTSAKVDDKRIELVQGIKEDNEKYIDFRSKMRLLINEFENRERKKQIQTIISEQKLYYVKIDEIIKILKVLFKKLKKRNEDASEDMDDDVNKSYFMKMADELIRYNRIKSFIFQPKYFLMFNKLNYNLAEDEIIILGSLLTQEYFENLVSDVVNPYIKHNSYDTSNPAIIRQVYSNEVVI